MSIDLKLDLEACFDGLVCDGVISWGSDYLISSSARLQDLALSFWLLVSAMFPPRPIRLTSRGHLQPGLPCTVYPERWILSRPMDVITHVQLDPGHLSLGRAGKSKP